MKKEMSVAGLIRRSWLQRTGIVILTVLPLTVAGSQCVGQKAPLSVEDVVRAARDVLDRVRDGRGTAEYYEWTNRYEWGFYRNTKGRDMKIVEDFYDCCNLTFIGSPRGQFRRDYRQRRLWDGVEPKELAQMLDYSGRNVQCYFNGEYELRFNVDKGDAEIPRQRTTEVLCDDYEKLHPLYFAHAYLTEALQHLNKTRLASYKDGLYTLEQVFPEITIVLTIDDKTGFSIKDIVQRYTGRLAPEFVAYRCQIDPVQWQSGIWLPGTVTVYRYRRDVDHPGQTKLVMQQRTTFTALEVNLGLRTADLEIALPIGTRLHDHRAGIVLGIGEVPNRVFEHMRQHKAGVGENQRQENQQPSAAKESSGQPTTGGPR